MDGEISPAELRSLLGVEADRSNDDVDSAGTDEPTDGDWGTSTGSPAESGDLRVVDVRPPAAFERGHIPGSENIPAPELTGRVEELDGAGRVVTVCPHGEASVQAARLVAAYRGVDGPVESLRGGLEAWDGPLETATGDGAADAESGGDDSPAPF